MPACFRVEMVRGLPNESGDLELEAGRELFFQEMKGKWQEISMHECNIRLWSRVSRVDGGLVDAAYYAASIASVGLFSQFTFASSRRVVFQVGFVMGCCVFSN